MPGFFVAQNCSPNLGENLNISLFNRVGKVGFCFIIHLHCKQFAIYLIQRKIAPSSKCRRANKMVL